MVNSIAGRSLAGLALGWAGCSLTLAAVPVSNLGTFAPGYTTSYATDINNAGQVAVTGETPGTMTAPPVAGVFRANVIGQTSQQIASPNTYLSTYYSGATLGKISSTGAIAGVIGNRGFGSSKSFVATGSTATQLTPAAAPTGPTGTLNDSRSTANDVNAAGTVVGSSTINQSFGTRAYVATFSASSGTYTYTNLGSKYDNALSSNSVTAWSINNAGTVVGTTPVTYGSGANAVNAFAGQAFVVAANADGTYTTSSATSGPMVVLGTLATPTTTADGVTYTPGESQALAISETGIVVGYAGTGTDGYSPYRAFKWTAATGMVNLGTLSGATGNATAYDVNDAGFAVGGQFLTDAFDAVSHAFYYDGTKMIDLNTLIDPASGWVLNTAYGINDGNQVVGQGTLNGVRTAFLVTVPEPASLTLAGLCAAGLLVRRRVARA